MNPARVHQAPSSSAPDWPTAFGVDTVMERRAFIGVISAALLAAPLAAEAQQPAKPVIGFLSSRSPDESAALMAAVRRGLARPAMSRARISRSNTAGPRVATIDLQC
jgi:hypothetical protein